jgi:hypothetical protein
MSRNIKGEQGFEGNGLLPRKQPPEMESRRALNESGIPSLFTSGHRHFDWLFLFFFPCSKAITEPPELHFISRFNVS